LNKLYLAEGTLQVKLLGRGMAWLDTGTHESLIRASTFVESIEERQGLKIACLEEISFRKGYISKEKLLELAKPLLKNQYGQYLLKISNEKFIKSFA
jgi:glucose-1-phosphate thymidylyltransferase